MSRATEAVRCVYCSQLIAADDDAQKVSKREVAHTACAFAADEASFFFYDQAQSEAEASNKK